jgi:AcrR family transcriptional regulator
MRRRRETTSMTDAPLARRRSGRPRDQELDAAIQAAGLELLIERGVADTTIEQIAQRANVTRATVYRRFPNKTDLLIHAIESAHHELVPVAPLWQDMADMVADWAQFLSQPILRRMLRRLYGSIDDYPELVQTYWDSHGQHHWSGVRAVLEQARDQGQFPQDADLDVIHEILYATIIYDLAAQPDTQNAQDIAERLTAVLRQTGYGSSGIAQKQARV